METKKNFLNGLLRMAAFLMALPLLFTACSSDDDSDPVPPTVKVQLVEGSATLNSISFEISGITNADSAKYVVATDNELAAITEDQVAKNGTKVTNLAGTTRVDLTDLQEATNYNVFVVAFGKKGLSASAMASSPTQSYNGITFTTGEGNRYSMNNTSITLKNDEGQQLELDCYYPDAKFLPSGTYTVVDRADYSACQIGTGRYSNYSYTLSDGTKKTMLVKGGTVKVELDMASKTYSVETDLTMDGTDTPLQTRFKGEIPGFDIFDVRVLDLVGAKRVDVNNPAPGEFYITANDVDWHCEMVLQFMCDPAAKELEAGTYTVGTTNAKGTMGERTYLNDYEFSSLGGTPKSGNVVVTKDGTKYTIAYDFTMESGQRYTGTYKGEIANMDLSE